VKIWWALGNNDMNQELITELSALKNVLCEEIISFEHEGQRFAISHYEGEAEKVLKGKKIDVWLHGHTHRAKAERNADGSVVINPGALFEDGKYIVWNSEKGTGERVFFNY
jgi:predicted phosphodiesterase